MGRKRKLFFEETPTKIRKISDFIQSPSTLSKRNSIPEHVQLLEDEIRPADGVHTITRTPSKSSKKVAVRNFREQWCHNRPWLKYHPETKSMYCTICQRAQAKNVFSVEPGCTVLKLENITKHEAGKGENSHTASEKVLNAGQQFQTAQRKLLEKSEASVTAAMRNIYFMAQFNLSNHIFADFNKHCINQGCSDLIGLKVDKHTTYEHSNSIHDFQDAISTVIIEDIIKSVDNKPYSIMIDESTDISVDQNLLIYIRFLNQSLGKFEPKSCLLGVRKLRDGATADKITQEIFESLNDFNINISNMCGIATDGAAVMVGRHSGVVTRIKETVPGLLSSHCIAHRLALASGAAADSVQYLVKFQEIISSIYKYFSKSPKNMSRLDKIFDIVKKSECEAHATRFKQVFHTRWLSFDGSVSAICENFSSLLSVLSEDKGAKAQGILKSVSSYKFLHCSFFMSDILKDLSILCKAYQSSTIEYTVVHPLLSVTVDKINGHFENEDGFMFTKFLDDVPSVFDCEKFHFKGHDIRDSGKYRDEAKSACRNFVSNLLENLNKRFSFEGDSEVLSSMCNIFNPILYSNDCKDKFLKSAKQVVQHFSDCKLNDFESEEMLDQIVTFSHVVKSSYSHCSNSINDVCQVALKHKEVYPYVYRAAEKLLTVPVSSVECERGFSRQNIIKTKLRNRLSTDSLFHLMMISLEGPSSDIFDFNRAFKRWADQKNRRICTVFK
ncbi:zinc finger protein 862-like [Mytilus edulis]|uniref:zinc finger protein 862-like n=1 Tax=Mytilus edulis TaxID=6550 RepID=UPI0039EEDAD8